MTKLEERVIVGLMVALVGTLGFLVWVAHQYYFVYGNSFGS